MKCPCEDCLCVPICRHKRYIPLVKCSMLNKYLMEASMETPSDKLSALTHILHPTVWHYQIKKRKGKSTPMISISSNQNER